YRLEAEPRLAEFAVHLPLRAVRELDIAVAEAFARTVFALEGPHLLGVDVHPRLREVGQTAGVIEVEMGQHDIAHVLTPVTEPLDLPDRGGCEVEDGVGQLQEFAAEPFVRA